MAAARAWHPWLLAGGGLLAHALAVQLIPWPWLVPNLTLAGLVAGVAEVPAAWLAVSGLAGALSMVWAGAGGAAIALSYLAAGALVRLAAAHWDTGDARVQTALTGLTACLVTGAWLAGGPPRPWPVLAWAVVHIGLTTAAGWMVAGGWRSSLRDA